MEGSAGVPGEGRDSVPRGLADRPNVDRVQLHPARRRWIEPHFLRQHGWQDLPPVADYLNGGPITLGYAFDLASLSILPNSPVSDWGQVLSRYQALGGGSPSFTGVPYGSEDYRVWAYDANDGNFASTSNSFSSSGIQYYFYGSTKINKHNNLNTTVWDNLACHEIGHFMGLGDLNIPGGLRSLGGCIGNSNNFQGPGPDDQVNLPAIYAAPAGS